MNEFEVVVEVEGKFAGLKLPNPARPEEGGEGDGQTVHQLKNVERGEEDASNEPLEKVGREPLGGADWTGVLTLLLAFGSYWKEREWEAGRRGGAGRGRGGVDEGVGEGSRGTVEPREED